MQPTALVVIWSPDPALASAVLPLGERLRIGRAGGEGLDLAIDDPKLSKLHAVVSRAGEGWRVEDLGSANGTFVGGARIRAGELGPGDVLRVGDTLFELGRDLPLAAASDLELVGRSPALAAVLAAADRFGPTPAAVLVTGPPGSGKELVARRLHRLSGRRAPMVVVACAAASEATLFGDRRGSPADLLTDSPGSWAEAQRGTVFLDDVEALPRELQPRVTRAIEAREYLPLGAAAPLRSDVRVVSATTVDLAAEVAAGRFDAELHALLAEQTIAVPSLAERRVDIPELTRHFLEVLAPGRRFTVNATFLEALAVQAWPQNVRELRDAIQHVIVASGERQQLRPGDLPPSYARAAGEGEPDAPPRSELEVLLARHRGNLARLVDHYGKARGQILRWLRRYGLDADDFRS